MDGGGGGKVISLYCHHQNDFCIKVAAMRDNLMFH